VTDNIYGLVIIIAKDARNIVAVQFKIKLFDMLESKDGCFLLQALQWTTLRVLLAVWELCKSMVWC